MEIPEEIIRLCWKNKIYGKIYIPLPKDSKAEDTMRAVLEEMEGVYEDMGTTFIREKTRRRVFSGFTIRKIRERHNVAYETARLIAKRSRERWTFWFNRHEAVRYDGLSGNDRFLYLKVRGMLRKGRPLDEIRNLYPGMDIDRLAGLARASIESTTWRKKNA